MKEKEPQISRHIRRCFLWELQTCIHARGKKTQQSGQRSRFLLCRYQITKQYRLIIIYSLFVNENCLWKRPSRVSCSSSVMRKNLYRDELIAISKPNWYRSWVILSFEFGDFLGSNPMNFSFAFRIVSAFLKKFSIFCNRFTQAKEIFLTREDPIKLAPL